MNEIINFFIKDPIVAVAGVISVVSLILIAILSFLYKRLRDEQRISEIVSAVEAQPQVKKRTKPATVEPQVEGQIFQQKISYQDIDLVVAQLSELTSQINNLNKHIQEISKTISALKESKSSDTGEGVSESTLVKLIGIVEKLTAEINSLKTVGTTSEIKEINSKLDNLLKLLSTILQQ